MCDHQSCHPTTFVGVQENYSNIVKIRWWFIFWCIHKPSPINLKYSNYFLRSTSGSLPSLQVKGLFSGDHILISSASRVLTVPYIKSFRKGPHVMFNVSHIARLVHNKLVIFGKKLWVNIDLQPMQWNLNCLLLSSMKKMVEFTKQRDLACYHIGLERKSAKSYKEYKCITSLKILKR